MKVYKSNNLNVLAGKLAEQLKQHKPADPLRARIIIVPNRETSGWLKLQLAEELGIAANLDFKLPSEWQFQMIRKLYPTLPSVLPSDPGPLSWQFFELLSEPEYRQRFERLDRYVNAQKESRETAIWQLSVKISSVFDQYLVYRPSMVLNWQKGVMSSEDPDETWQAELWNLVEEQRKVKEKGSGFPNRAELIREATAALRAGDIEINSPLNIFNPHLQPESLFEMAEACSTNPPTAVFQCVVSDDPEGRNRHPLLDAFGEELEGVKQLVDHFSEDIETELTIPENTTSLLSHIRRSISQGKSGDSFIDETSSSVVVRSCHSPLREVEVLHQFLLKMLQDDPGLHPDDILVAMPDPETYAPAIHAVFGAGEQHLPSIPYHLDHRMRENNAVKAFEQLLNLADSRYYMTDVMDLLMNPSVRETFMMTEQAAGRLKRWVNENTVIWGLDSDHRVLQEQPPESLNTWQAAIDRIWRGQIYGRDRNPFENPSDLRFHDVEGREQEDAWAGFHKLLAGLRWLNAQSRQSKTAVNWCDEMEDVISYFLTETGEDENRVQPVYSILQTIRDEAECASANTRISFGLFRTLAKTILGTHSSSSASFTRGVTFSSMVPVRSIPAKVIALIGLNEGEYPRKLKKIDFDIMAKQPRATDRNPKNQDRSLFLESVMAAEKVHYCSYIGQSRQDNEEIPPSPVVSEWIGYLMSETGSKKQEIVTEESLHGFSPENFTGKRSFSAGNYNIAREIMQNQSAHRGLYLSSNEMDTDTPEVVALGSLLNFISNPLREFIQYHFGARLRSMDDETDEFMMSALDKHILFGRILEWRMRGIEFNAIDTLLIQTGQFPSGWQGEAELQELMKDADEALGELLAFNENPGQVRKTVSLPVGAHQISGELVSYSRDRLLLVTPSSTKGDRVISGWVRHLMAQLSGEFPQKSSLLLSNLKKTPEWIRFRTAENPENKLQKLLQLYLEGLKKPPLFFSNTSYAYAVAEAKKAGSGPGKARFTFEGSRYNNYSENRDIYTELFLDQEASFEENFLRDDYLSIIDEIRMHTEEVK